MLKELIFNTAFQWVALLIIPILVYLIFFRKNYNIFSFFGFKKPKKIKMSLLLITLIISLIYIGLSTIWLPKYDLLIEDIRLLSFNQTGLSIQTILIIIINSIFLTSFLEEIIFRGFLINSLRYKLGFTFANHIQAIIFTGIHVLAMLDLSLIEMLLGTILIYLLSVYFGKITKASGYSIVYSAIFHGSMNILAAIMIILMS